MCVADRVNFQILSVRIAQWYETILLRSDVDFKAGHGNTILRSHGLLLISVCFPFSWKIDHPHFHFQPAGPQGDYRRITETRVGHFSKLPLRFQPSCVIFLVAAPVMVPFRCTFLLRLMWLALPTRIVNLTCHFIVTIQIALYYYAHFYPWLMFRLSCLF